MDNMKAKLKLNTAFNTGEIDPRIFSGFLEHLGRAIYGGVYDPDNDLSDSNGLRRDVVEAMTGLNMPFVRYPGGNFVSNYDWRDGVGAERKPFPDFAWRATEPNQFGVDEFMKWCQAVGTSPMLAINLGTLGPKEGAEFVEYCNLNTDTYWSNARRINGNAEPYNVKMWCLGNEMDGPWQAGHVPADQYSLKARNAARLIRGIDPSVELIAAGSSGRFMSTYMEWDRTVLETCWDDINFISAHRYSNNSDDDTLNFLAEGTIIDSILTDYASVIRYVKARNKSNHNIYVSFDEWNVWYRERSGENRDANWKIGTPQLEEIYNLEDALVCAQYLNAFIRRSDLVKVACLAQIVNVIAPVITSPSGILKQTIYFPSAMYSRYAKGISLTPIVESPFYDLSGQQGVPFLDASASFDRLTGRMSLFLVNRSIEENIRVEIDIADREIMSTGVVQELSGNNPKLSNSWENPNNVVPKPMAACHEGGGLFVDVPRLGLVVISDLETKER